MSTAAPKERSWTERIGEGLGEEQGRPSVLYQGPDKTRKTSNALTWPNPVVFYFDANTGTLENWPEKEKRVVLVKSFREFQTQMVPAIVNRRLADVFGVPVDTVVIDTASSAADLCQHEMMRESGNAETGEFDMKQYGRLKNKLYSTFRQVVDAKKPKGTHPGYYVAITAHEQAWTKLRKGQSEPVIDRIRPRIEGGFKDILPSLVDSVFLTRIKRGKRGPHKQEAPTPYIVTVPPDDLYFCGDGYGNDLGRDPLPVEMPGDFPSLAAAWGLPGYSKPDEGNNEESNET